MKRIMLVAAGLSLGLLLPQNAAASSWASWGDTDIWGPDEQACAGSTLQSCVNFSLRSLEEVLDGVTITRYFFSVKYTSSLALDPGVIKSVGLYDKGHSTKQETEYNFFDINMVQPLSWLAGTGSCSLTGDGANVKQWMFEACADKDGSAHGGISQGGTVTFSFRSNLKLEPDLFTADGFGARAHIISFGEAGCSFKLDSWTGQVSGPDDLQGNIDGCGTPGTSVPEPMTMLLLGSGLFGIGGVAIRRRRRELDVETEDTQI